MAISSRDFKNLLALRFPRIHHPRMVMIRKLDEVFMPWSVATVTLRKGYPCRSGTMFALGLSPIHHIPSSSSKRCLSLAFLPPRAVPPPISRPFTYPSFLAYYPVFPISFASLPTLSFHDVALFCAGSRLRRPPLLPSSCVVSAQRAGKNTSDGME